MTKPITHRIEPKYLRQVHRQARHLASNVHSSEQELIRFLHTLIKERMFVSLGFKALRPYLVQHLKFTRVQAQRIATEVRRYQPISHQDDVQDREFEAYESEYN